MTRSLWIATAALMLMGCNKKAGKYNPDFIGTWRTEPYTVNSAAQYSNEIIIEESDGAYRLQCSEVCEPYLCNCSNEVTGTPLVSSDKKLLKIGSANSITLPIDEEPYENSAGEWIMKIDGKEYRKQ
jgi:hypothetical protein